MENLHKNQPKSQEYNTFFKKIKLLLTYSDIDNPGLRDPLFNQEPEQGKDCIEGYSREESCIHWSTLRVLCAAI